MKAPPWLQPSRCIFKIVSWNVLTMHSLALSALRFLCLIVFLFLCICQMIQCIVKSLIATSTYFLFKCNWKNKTWKKLFQHQSLGTQTSIPVSQTTWIRPYTYQWNKLLKYWSLKLSLLIIESSSCLAWTWNVYYLENKEP